MSERKHVAFMGVSTLDSEPDPVACSPASPANTSPSGRWSETLTGPIVSALFGRDGEGPSSGSNDEGTAVQCQVTASNGGGIVIADNINPLRVAPVPTEQSELPGRPSFEPEEGPSPSLPNSAETIGPVSVSDHLPDGLVFAGEAGLQATGSGWECKVETPMNATCLRSDTLEPGGSYPPIVLRTRVEPSAATGTPPSGGVTNTVPRLWRGRVTGQCRRERPYDYHSSRTPRYSELHDERHRSAGGPFYPGWRASIRGDRHVCAELHRLERRWPPATVRVARPRTSRQNCRQASSGIPKTCRPNVLLLSISRRLRFARSARGSASFMWRWPKAARSKPEGHSRSRVPPGDELSCIA